MFTKLLNSAMNFTVSLFLLAFILAMVEGQRGPFVMQVGVGDYCAPGGAPTGPDGAFQVIESSVRKVCTPGTSCRNGACNCDNFPDGTVTSISVDPRGNRMCKRVAGQRCYNDFQCFFGVRCIRGVCTCDPRNRNDYCVDSKNDVYILV